MGGNWLAKRVSRFDSLFYFDDSNVYTDSGMIEGDKTGVKIFDESDDRAEAEWRMFMGPEMYYE